MQALIAPGPGPGPWRQSIAHVRGTVLDNARALAEHEVRVQVEFAGLDFPQVLTVEGKHVRPLRATPCVLGRECAGRVVETGRAVTLCKLGDWVFGDCLTGAWSSLAVMREDEAVVFDPSKVSARVMAGVALNYATSFHALVHQGQVAKGETVLVLGAGGGVGSAAVDIAKALGCRVIACASSLAKLAEAKRCGADEVVNYAQDPASFRKRVEALAPGGVDVCYDPVGGSLSEQAIRMLRLGGRHLVVGFASGGDTPKSSIPHIPLNLALLNERKIVGVLLGSWKAAHPREARDMMVHIARMCEQGVFHPEVTQVFELHEWVKAVEGLMGRDVVGKVVFRVAGVAGM